MSNKLVSSFELSRNVAKLLEIHISPNESNQGFMHSSVIKVMTTYSKFVSHHFKKSSREGIQKATIICDVPYLG